MTIIRWDANIQFYLLNFLKTRTTSPAAFTRATVVIAVKYSVVERPEKIDDIIYPEISSFLMLIKDDDRVSLIFLMLNSPNPSVGSWLLDF